MWCNNHSHCLFRVTNKAVIREPPVNAFEILVNWLFPWLKIDDQLKTEVVPLLSRSYNLGQNKMEQQTPIPPNQGWSRAMGKNAPFSHPWFGGRGGLGFPFIFAILDKIKWNSKPHPPQIKDEAARRAKTRHFPILDLGGRGGLGFPFILSKIVGLPRWPLTIGWAICAAKDPLWAHKHSELLGGESGLNLGQQSDSYSANLRTYWQYLAASQGDKMLFQRPTPAVLSILLQQHL